MSAAGRDLADRLRAVVDGLPRFRPRFPWVNGDLQTLRNAVRERLGLSEPSPPRGGERLWFDMPDGTGDRLAALYDRPASPDPAMPLTVLAHGLTGCEDALYMQRMAAALLDAGGPVLRLNLRGAGPSRPTSQQQYHAGRSSDLRAVLTDLPATVPDPIPAAGIVLVGVSLGANMLLKFLGEAAAPPSVRAAIAVSAPIDLAATSLRMRAPRNGVYHRAMLARMREEALAAPVVSPEERAAVVAARTVYDFDEGFVAPRNGFRGADHYYAVNSAERFLPTIAVPTVILHADDDPWIEMAAYDRVPFDRYPNLVPVLTRGGGHVGFHSRDSAMPHDWLCALTVGIAQEVAAYSAAQPDAASSNRAAAGAA